MTPGAVSLICRTGDEKTAFCGEVIYSPGKIARIAPLQYNYNDLPGAINLIGTVKALRKQHVDILAPSLGQPILENTEGALTQLEKNLRFVLSGRADHLPRLEETDKEPLMKVSNHIYQSTYGGASTWFLISDSGKVLSIDYGYNLYASTGADTPHPRNRRAILHGIDGLEKRFGIDRIDVVLVTHFHDDHVAGIALLQRLYRTQCWAGENFAGLLANPESHRFPCTWPEPIDVKPQILGQPVKWEEYTFTLYPMSGHTRWSSLIEFEADGMKIIATGDQYFFMDFADPGKAPMMENHAPG